MAGVLFFALAVISCPHPLQLLFAVLIHEAGHILTAALLGWGTPSVQMSPCGMRLVYRGRHPTLPALAVSLGGSFFGSLCALIPFLPEELRLYSVGFAVFNLIPVSGLDGGGALLFLCEAFMLPDRAYRVSRAVSVVSVLLFWALSVLVQMKAGANLTLLAVSVYLTVSTLSEGG